MRIIFRLPRTQAGIVLAVLFIVSSFCTLHARPVPHVRKGASPQTLLRQTNTKSNVEFFYTNRGVLFNAGNGNSEGLFWPRGSGNSYIFGGGLWFATKKEIAGKRQKLCDIGYNPNSGAGWYTEGEASQVGLTIGTDGSNPAAKYISYVSPRYDRVSGKFIPGSSNVVPAPFYSWPLWDTSSSKTFEHNYYFGDYISDVSMRNVASLQAQNIGKTPKPAMVSEEDIVNIYSDKDSTNNPEFVKGTGYPFGIDIQEAIYTWSYGQYRDMIFVRYKVKNSSTDTLLDCWMAPAFDADLGTAGGSYDANSYVNDSIVNLASDPTMASQLREPYRSDPTKLNMGYQYRNPTKDLVNGHQYGMVGFSFLESTVVNMQGNIIANDDSEAMQGYGPNSLFQKKQEGLVTCKNWTIMNDPTTQALRYDFISSGDHDKFNGYYGDQRLMMATGPFTLAPGKSAEATIVITFAQASLTDPKKNFGALLLLTDLAHQVFGELDSTQSGGTTDYFVNHFQVPPPSSVKSVSAMSGLTIEQPYPNPFSTICSINYSNSIPGPASAIVTDVLGRTVRSLSLGYVAAGEHQLSIGDKDLPAGAYSVTVTVGYDSQTTSMVRY